MIIDIISICVGVLLIIFCKQFSRFNVKIQNKYLGMKFDEREVKGGEIAAILIGIGAIIMTVARIMSN